MQPVTPEDQLAVQAGRLHFPGCNYSLFDLLRHWTYVAVHKNLDCNASQWEEVVLAHAEKLNENLTAPGTPEDVAHLARQSASWTRQKFVTSDPVIFKQNQRLMAQRRNREAGREPKVKVRAVAAPKPQPQPKQAAFKAPKSPMRRESWAGSKPMWRDDT
jgi:hypothetical protein